MSRFLLAAPLILALSLPTMAQTIEDARTAFFDGDYARAAQIAEPLAAAGDAVAINLLARLYEDGLGGFAPDPARAFQLYAQAAELGLARAQNTVGRIYHYGELGQLVDPLRAEQMYLRAIDNGDIFAINNYALLQEEGRLGAQDWPRILALYAQAADLDEPNAAANLTNIYLNGRDNLPEDPVLARQWGERAVAVESTRGMRMLGYMMEFGVGGPVDVPRAIALYTQAFEAGVASAANDLGLLYQNGAPGVPSNLAQAAQWYESAVAMNDPYAYLNLGDLLVDGEPSVPDDAVRARALYGVAHSAGNLDASVALAYLHWDGEGGPVDYAEAERLLTHAADEGDIGAVNDLGVMRQQGLGGPINFLGAAELYLQAAQGGHTLATQNLAFLLTDNAKPPYDPVEGVAWCHFGAERETDPATRVEYRANCADLAEGLNAAERSLAITRSAALLAEY